MSHTNQPHMKGEFTPTTREIFRTPEQLNQAAAYTSRTLYDIANAYQSLKGYHRKKVSTRAITQAVRFYTLLQDAHTTPHDPATLADTALRALQDLTDVLLLWECPDGVDGRLAELKQMWAAAAAHYGKKQAPTGHGVQKPLFE